MFTSTSLDAPTEQALKMVALERPRPLHSLLASAKRITSENVVRMGSSGKMESWQEDAWDLYDIVGEQRFLANTIANRMSSARMFVGKVQDKRTDDVEEQTSGAAYDAFTVLNGSHNVLKQMIMRLGINLFIAGDSFLVGVPNEVIQEAQARDGRTPPPQDALTPFGQPVDASDSDDGEVDGANSFAGIDLTTFVWRTYSVSEVTFAGDAQVKIKGEGGRIQIYDLDAIVLIRIWRPHPRWWWRSDSPTRSSLPVLRELVGLTMHISAQIDSRLAGAGMLLIPESADRALRASAGLPEDGEEVSPLGESLMEAMLESIRDRSNASAVVPIMPVVPDDSIDKFRYMSFATPLDLQVEKLRNEAIRRLALGEDCPPELLLGVNSMNHWGAWLVREDVVVTHVEPPLALICDALTTQFLWPVLEDQGMSKDEYEQYVVWYDVSHLIIRPDRVKDAFALHAVGTITDDALRDSAGFGDAEAPTYSAIANNDPVNTLALNLVRSMPALLSSPGLTVIVEQLQAMLEGKDIPMPAGAPIPVEGQAGSNSGAPTQPNPYDIPVLNEPKTNPDGTRVIQPTLKKTPTSPAEPAEPGIPSNPGSGNGSTGDMPDDQG